MSAIQILDRNSEFEQHAMPFRPESQSGQTRRNHGNPDAGVPLSPDSLSLVSLSPGMWW